MNKNKRFKIIDKQFISYYGGYAYLIGNGNFKFWLWHNESESQKVCDKLNSIMEWNDDLKSTLAYRSNQLALAEQLVDDLGSEEMGRQMDVILND